MSFIYAFEKHVGLKVDKMSLCNLFMLRKFGKDKTEKNLISI